MSVAYTTTIINEMPYWYSKGSIVLYEWVKEELDIILQDSFKVFYKVHFTWIGVQCGVCIIAALSGIFFVNSLIQKDLIEVKEAYRVVPLGVYMTNKYMRNNLIMYSGKTVQKFGTKLFN